MRTEALRELRNAFHDHAGWYRNKRGRVACWLWQFDDRHMDCWGRLEAIHLIGRQRIRNRLINLDADTLRTIEWDPRNAAVACTRHHRRFDSHATPTLRVPAHALPRQALAFISERGLEVDAEAKFTGNLNLALAMSSVPSVEPTTLQVPESSPAIYLAGQPSA